MIDDGRFLCRFYGCLFLFKFDGKSWRKYEFIYNLFFVIEESINLFIILEKFDMESIKKVKIFDDVFNYNCVILIDGLFFLNFLDVVFEGDG